MADSIDVLARRQFRLFSEIGDRICLTQDDRRRALGLSESQWRAWSAIIEEAGPLPRQPDLSEMLCRLGTAAFTLTVLAEDASAE